MSDRGLGTDLPRSALSCSPLHLPPEPVRRPTIDPAGTLGRLSISACPLWIHVLKSISPAFSSLPVLASHFLSVFERGGATNYMLMQRSRSPATLLFIPLHFTTDFRFYFQCSVARERWEAKVCPVTHIRQHARCLMRASVNYLMHTLFWVSIKREFMVLLARKSPFVSKWLNASKQEGLS